MRIKGGYLHLISAHLHYSICRSRNALQKSSCAPAKARRSPCLWNSHGSNRSGRYKLLIRPQWQPREERAPRLLPAVVSDQVLADLDLNVKHAASLAMHWNGVVRRIAHAIGLVVADK